MDVRDAISLKRAIRALAKDCPVIRRAHEVVGEPEWRRAQRGYAGIARIIAFQQVSTRAAAAIWARVETGLGRVSAQSVLDAPEGQMRDYGLSRPKVAHLRSVAEAVQSGKLNFGRIARASDDVARAELVAVRGIGPWTADVYLMCALGRPDVFPHADIGLSEAYKMLTQEEKRPSPSEFLAIGERWRPLRGVAAHVLWAYINHQRDQARGGA